MALLEALTMVFLLQSAQAILNSTSVVVRDNGWTIYPCFQVDHRETQLENAVMGQWYVYEIIYHRQDPKTDGVQMADTCPKVNLMMLTLDDLRLTWTEKAGDVRYSFRLPDPENRGFWLSWDKQSGMLLRNKKYVQFEGSAQVLEAHPYRMVVTFCSQQRSHYSMVMVRNVTVVHNTRDVHTAIQRFHLPEYGTSQTCRQESSGAPGALPSLTLLLALVLLGASRLN